MVNRKYREYMKSERWQRKRQAVFRRYGKRCMACYTVKPPIQVHHLDYARFGNENLDDLMPLCSPCHKQVTFLYKKGGRRNLRRITWEYVYEARRVKKMGRQPANQGRRNERRKRNRRGSPT